MQALATILDHNSTKEKCVYRNSQMLSVTGITHTVYTHDGKVEGKKAVKGP